MDRPLDRSLGLDGKAAKLRRLLHDCEDYINSEYDVDKLCSAEFLERMADLRDRVGYRLKYRSLGCLITRNSNMTLWA